MMNKLLFLFLSLFFLFLVACDPVDNPPPNIVNFTDINDTYDYPLNISIVEINISDGEYFIEAGQEEVKFVIENQTMDVYNCGNTAHGLVIADEIQFALDHNITLRNLIITNISWENAGGCVDLIVTFPEFDNIILRGNLSVNQQYDDIEYWTPPDKLIIESG